MTRPFRDYGDPPPNYVFEGDLEWALRKLRPWAVSISVLVLTFLAAHVGIAEMKQRPVERVLVAEIWR